jgi:hypothetical protein
LAEYIFPEAKEAILRGEAKWCHIIKIFEHGLTCYKDRLFV